MLRQLWKVTSITYTYDERTQRLDRLLARCLKAVDEGAECLVLPAACNVLVSSSEQLSCERECLDKMESSVLWERAWQAFVDTHQVVLIGGLYTTSKEGVADTILVMSPESKPVRYVRTHLRQCEEEWMQRGDRPGLVSLGDVCIGVMSGYDVCFPELPRLLVLEEAEVLFCLGVGPVLPYTSTHNSVLSMCQSHGYFSGVFSVCTWGGEGLSSMSSPFGVLRGESEELDLRQARFKYRTKRVHPLKDRREALYASIVSSKGGGE